MKVASSAEMKTLDQRAIEEYGIPGVVLMENAAIQLVRVLLENYKQFTHGKFFIFCGKGNNGGDGFAIARHLANQGRQVNIILLAEPEKIGGDAAVNLRIAQKMGLPFQTITTSEKLLSLRQAISGQDLVIDAIFGTGLSTAVRGFYKEAIDFINELPNQVVAVDIPSGLNADTGKVEGSCIRADLTISFGLPKMAHLLTPASTHVGCLEVVGISIPPKLVEEAGIKVNWLEKKDVAGLLGSRPLDSHKGDYGHLLIMGGSEGKGGAPAMAALAGLRSGAGLVTLAVPEKVHQAIEMGLMEVMSEPLNKPEKRILVESSYENLEPLLAGKSALVIGPGIGAQPETGKFLQKVIASTAIPMIIDADGLNLLALDKKILERKNAPIILTPHPGEMGRLMNIPTKEVQSNRLEVAMDLAQSTGCFIVLKGAGTIVASPQGDAFINTTGNPGMATAGTGDVLAGMVGGFLAQGLGPEEATNVGVFLHGLAGDLAAKEFGERSLIAGDMIQVFPRALQTLLNDE